jgi:hypothetical protein
MREEARRSLRAKRTLWRALGIAEDIAGPVPIGDLVEIVYEQLVAKEAAGGTWTLVNGEPPPLRWRDTGRKMWWRRLQGTRYPCL